MNEKIIELTVQSKLRDEEIESKFEHLDLLERKIVRELYSFCHEAYQRNRDESKWKGNRPWTNLILQKLAKLGENKKLLVYPKKKDNDKWEGEWLLDLVWLKAYENIWEQTRKLVLACECEWGMTKKEILEDFYKLTFVRADYRLFIYQYKTNLKTENYPVNICKEAIKHRQLEGKESYLFVGYPMLTSKNLGLRIDKIW